ncbi:MAG: serine hydrolase domain-containing protein [Gemmataceae bacterium]
MPHRACFLLLLAASPLYGQLDAGRIDAAVARALDDRRAPGAVVLVLRDGRVLHRKAYGARQVQPTREPMTVDTVFDLASLTKPIATGTAAMLLVQDGKLRLDDKVSKHLPEFAQNGKGDVTVEQLMLHTSGLIADNPLKEYLDGRAKAFENIHALKLTAKPGEQLLSDVNFLVLSEVVELSGMPLGKFCRKRVFEPLGMKDTAFRPVPALAARAAPDRGEG